MNLTDIKEVTSGPCVLVMVGVSGSGKSTIARELASNDSEVVSSDHYREVLCGDAGNQHVSGQVFQMIYEIIGTRSSYTQRTILDATNLKRQDRKAYYGPVAKGLPTYAVIVDTPRDLCVERQQLRDRQVPEWVIDKQYQRFEDTKRIITEAVEEWTGIFLYDSLAQVVSVLR